jgi:hypothetical protein
MNKKISRSSDHGQFSREVHIKSREEKGLEPNQKYLDFLDNFQKNHEDYINDLKNQVNNLEYDLRTTDWILEKARNSKEYAQNLYAAMCNNEFQKKDVFLILKDERWSCSWRSAGGIIANMRQEGDYIDWYCSGIKETDSPEDGYVPESVVTDEIREDLNKLGWIVITDEY